MADHLTISAPHWRQACEVRVGDWVHVAPDDERAGWALVYEAWTDAAGTALRLIHPHWRAYFLSPWERVWWRPGDA